MLFISQIRVGALELIILSSVFFVLFVHVFHSFLRTCSHGRRVQGEEYGGLPHSALCSLASSSATPPEELLQSAVQ